MTIDSMTALDPIQVRMREIRNAFLAALPERVAEMERAARSRSSAADLALRAHSLVGTAGTFGLGELARIARQLEGAANRWQDGADGTAPDIASALDGLRAEARLALETDAPAEQFLTAKPFPIGDEALICLLEDDPDQAAELTIQLEPYGYRVAAYPEPATFLAGVRGSRPDALLVDIMCGNDLLAGPNAVSLLKREGMKLPVVFLSSRSDFRARLESVRAGGDGYVTKPVDTATLVERLDLLTGRERPEPLRILVVDDDPHLGASYSAILRAAGMEVSAILDPSLAIEAIRSFGPDLLLTDNNMPGCSGLELAAVLRQHQGLLSLPILFLTADEEAATRRTALDLGADDFLPKPITPELLVQQVRARAKRARTLNALMVRDSLTGALNHAMVQEHLLTEVSRARGERQPLCFAMIDVDHFKRVNDTHGHAAGDRVLKALARMLQQRLRRTDIVGRYGGEEFAVILPRTGPAEALALLDKLRATLAGITFRDHYGAPFEVTFSAGIAALGESGDAGALNLAADGALYVAKRAGRNRVVAA